MLRIAYITHFEPQFTNAATIIVMGFSSPGVIKWVLIKRKIVCACLGTFFNSNEWGNDHRRFVNGCNGNINVYHHVRVGTVFK